MAFSRLSTGRSRNSHHSAEFACELGGKGSGIVAITRAPLTRTMSGHVVDSVRGLSEVPLNHGGAPPTRRSKRTMSQIRRVCPPDAELKRRIRKVLLSDPDMRFGSAVTMGTRQRCMKQLEDECGCSLKHKTGFIHKEMERISLGPGGKTSRAGMRQARSATEAALICELKSTLGAKAAATEGPQVEQVDESIPLGRTTSALERQLRDALEDAHDVLQHTDDAFDTVIPTNTDQQDLPDLISPDPRPDSEERGEDESYVTVTSEEVNHACGDLLEEDAEQQTLQPASEQSQQSVPDYASPIDQLSVLREKLRQIRSVTEETAYADVAVTITETETETEAEAEAEAKNENEAVADTAEAVDTQEDTTTDESAKTPPSPEQLQPADISATESPEAVNNTQDYRTELEQKSRKELQTLAKEHGIKANQSSSKIIDALCAQ